MPPKQDKGQKKAEQKKKDKIIEDKTFGLKNKNKSKQVQKQIKGIVQNVKGQGIGQEQLDQAKFLQKQEKKKLLEEQAMLAQIYGNVTQVQKLAAEEVKDDPKLIICPYFKKGLCQKGKKCKYSHDLSSEVNQKIDLYTDQREQIFGEAEDDTIDKWDTNKLEEVVKFNENKYKSQIPTDIICKFFLDAIEKGKYGWNWVCPNGMICHYRHCLPPGFVFKGKQSEAKKGDDEDIVTLEEELQEKIDALAGKQGTPVTLEKFMVWKEQKRQIKEQKNEEKKQEELKKNKGKTVLSGRALFQFDPTLFVDDEEAGDTHMYAIREDNQDDDEDDNEENYQKFRDQFQGQEPNEEEEDDNMEWNEEDNANQEQDGNEENQEEEKQENIENNENNENDQQKESKKKKKKKKKQEQQDEQTTENNNVKINDELFLNQGNEEEDVID